MKTNEKSKLIPIKELVNGMWLTPEAARHYFRNGRGITLGTMMNKIRGKKLLGRVKHDHTGWYVWVSNEAIENKKTLQAA